MAKLYQYKIFLFLTLYIFSTGCSYSDDNVKAELVNCNGKITALQYDLDLLQKQIDQLTSSVYKAEDDILDLRDDLNSIKYHMNSF